MRQRKCCDECSRRRKKLSECRPRGPGRKCWSCAKWVRECSFVHHYPKALLEMKFELSREEKQLERTAQLRQVAIDRGIVRNDREDDDSGISAAVVDKVEAPMAAQSSNPWPAPSPSFFVASSPASAPASKTWSLRAVPPPAKRVRRDSPNPCDPPTIRCEPQARCSLAAAAANAAASALQNTDMLFLAESEAAAATTTPNDAAKLALVAWAAASAESIPQGRGDKPIKAQSRSAYPFDMFAVTAKQEGTLSYVLSVPSMMCLGSCGKTIENALSKLPNTRLVGINVARRLVHCHTSSTAQKLIDSLDEVGFDASVVSVSEQTSRLAIGSRRDDLQESTEWEIADALGLVSTSCSRRSGGTCNCGPSCMCHYCPVHHPDRAASLSTVASQNVSIYDSTSTLSSVDESRKTHDLTSELVRYADDGLIPRC